MDFDEFLMMMANMVNDVDSEDYRAQFRVFDRNGNGSVNNRHRLQSALHQFPSEAGIGPTV